MKPSILIADDHPLILKGLKDFLLEKDYDLVATANNGRDAFTLIKGHKPDIAILDINMPIATGMQVAKKCKDEFFKTKIVFLTLNKDEKIFIEAKALGIYGYVLKEFALVEIEQCIEAVTNNNTYFSPELLAFLEAKNPPEELATLTPTERRVLLLIAKENTAKEIAEIMFISPRTVEKHKSHIIKKLKLESKSSSLLLFVKENESFLKQY